MSFDAHEEKVMGLFNRKVYSIPRNQRRYVWNTDNWQELYDDVQSVVNGLLQSHFIGSIVLKEDPIFNGLPHYSVIDGQQRIITLSIFLSSIMFWMKKKNMNSDFNGTIPYLIAKDDKANDIVMVTTENNGSLENIIQVIVNLDDDSAKKKTVTSIVDGNILNKSDKIIGDAFKFYLNKIGDLIKDKQNPEEILIGLRNAVRDISFVNITATTEEDSYTIFEILNARGLDLEDHELLKNYIMRYIQPERDRDKAKAEWHKIEESLGSTNIKKFVRHYTIHRYGDYRSKFETSDYKIIQDRNRGKRTWDLLMDLEKKSSYYLKLVSPSTTVDSANCTDLEYSIFSFFKKKRHEQMRPVLLSLITKKEEGELDEHLYERTIKFLYNFYICYNIIGEENSNRLTDIVNKFSAKINRDCSEENIQMFVDELRSKLPSKEMFINAFKNVGWSHHSSIYEGEKNKTRVQTVLEVFERFNNANFCLENFTIEHILPDSSSPENGQIGNLIPLEENYNLHCKDKELNDKMAIYQKSVYASTRMFAQRYRTRDFDPAQRSVRMAEMFYDKILRLS